MNAPSWRSRIASLLSTSGHETTTAVLPGLLAGLHPSVPLALSLIEAAGNGAQGIARFLGAELGGRTPHRRRRLSTFGHLGIGLSSSLLALATSVAQISIFRVGSYAARGLRSPLRHGQAIEATSPLRAGRAVGFERSVSHAAAVLGPLAAAGLMFVFSPRATIALSIVPVTIALLLTTRGLQGDQPGVVPEASLRARLHQLRHGRLGRHLAAVTAYQLSSIAPALLLLRSAKVLGGSFTSTELLQVVALFYAVFQASAAVSSNWCGRLVDMFGTSPVISLASMALLGSYLGFALAPKGALLPITICFVLAGSAAGAVETAEITGIARYARAESTWTALGVLTAIQSFGRMIATAVAGLLWTTVQPAAGLLYCTPLLLLATALSYPHEVRKAD
ncbi:MFS transporter [Kribbella sp. NPDC055071]